MLNLRQKANEAELNDVREAALKYATFGHNSFRSSESEALLQTCTKMISIDAMHGKIDSKNILRGRLRVRKDCKNKREEIRDFVKQLPNRYFTIYGFFS